MFLTNLNVAANSYSEGMFISMNPNHHFDRDIKAYVYQSEIPNIIDCHHMHQTLIYSKGTYCERFLSDCRNGLFKDTKFLMRNMFLRLHYVPKKDEDGYISGSEVLLIVDYSCPELSDFQQKLLEIYNLTHTYPSLMNHITLSYDISDFLKQKGIYNDDKKLDEFIRQENILFQKHMRNHFDYHLHNLEVQPIEKDFEEKNK